ncbi:DUF4118 domain-containing protein [Dactylosporangium sp. AC04546]|uniref:sensor histidine kinase n=1 Tax=Dactylosporangium sp. AC04546 TaxID=2862460 RepID=UPI002E7B2284|nr:DUF4118 domain-containing protein [Dactylosporangium sp. AC04546]WVK80882.1 DUF4118 domain-containing protein [Dactylosporangium sp. AC04546]
MASLPRRGLPRWSRAGSSESAGVVTRRGRIRPPMRACLLSLVLRPPPISVGILVAAGLIAVETLALLPMHDGTHQGARGVVYLIGVLIVSTVWGATLGVLTSLASTVAFNYFHVLPFGVQNLSASRDLQDIATFVVAALLVSTLADLVRSHAVETSERHEEAGLFADLGRLLLRARNLSPTLDTAAQRVAQTLHLPSAAIKLGIAPADARCIAFPLHADTTVLGTLLVPNSLSEHTLQRLRLRLVPALASVLQAACEREAITESLKASRERSALLATQQAALRRVATLVARRASPAEVFDAVAEELAQVVGPYPTALYRYESDGIASRLAGRNELKLREQSFQLTGDSLLVKVLEASAPARMESYEHLVGPNAEIARRAGIRSSVGVPVVVEGRVWGVAVVVSTEPEPLPPDTEARMADFTELVATAIANAESHAELSASRVRIIAAGDQARRRIERDLHDGAQQQLVALCLRLRMIEASLPVGLDPVRAELSQVVDTVTSIFQDLQELSRGIHPAVLSKGGLGPALKTLARRSPTPVDISLTVDRKVPEPVEVCTYYVVSEALTNATKHAQATLIRVDVNAGETYLRICIRDNGIGGANADRGSGLIGLRDRIATLGGHISVTSPTGRGTTLRAEIPIDHA